MSSDPAAKEPRRRIRIGKYEVVAHVATGGMGAVYRARDTEDGREVALKVLSPDSAAKPGMVERFRREARHAAKLRHENVVTLYEFGEANQTYFLAMEFVEGIDLHEYCNRNGALDPDEALEIIRQGCRALDHAFQRGVIHRDVKPSNFLLAQKGERVVVKLTDLGLARESSGDEFRVTRAGTTVGTLDYMAPEQARDSGLADIRSDLYALGSTWYHLLASHAPFPRGGLGERLNRILNEDPPDIRQFNARVSDDTAAVVHRLLAKRPAQRYQTPAELLDDLDALARGEPPVGAAEPAAPPAPEKDDKATPPPRSGKKGRRKSARSRPDTDAARSTAERRAARAEPSYFRLYLFSSLAAVVLVAGLVTFFLMRRGHRAAQAEDNPTSAGPAPIAAPSLPPEVRPEPGPGRNPGENTLVALPKKPSWPALYQPFKPIDRATLQKEVEAPWAATAAANPTVELVVGRLPPDPAGKTFRSLADACKAVPAGATALIRLRDNGPFFDVPAVVADRNLIIRPAEGYRPLLVWDVSRTLDERRRNRDRKEPAADGPPVFLGVTHGNLTLEGVHVALKWPEAPSEGAAVLRVADGDLTVSGCTFSVVGKPRDGVTLARFTAAGGGDRGARCRFSRCHARGAGLSMLDLAAPGGHVLFEDCLLVGGDAPLMEVRAGTDPPTHISAVRTTMVAGKNLLTVQPTKPTDHDPALRWLGWDCLLSRRSREAGGELLRLEGGTDTHGMSWRATNCLYAGWETLLSAGPASIPAADAPGWRRVWDRIEGDVTRPEPWPAIAPPEPAEAPAATYRTAGSPVAYASTAGPEHLLGCDPDALPPVRDNWLALTFDRFAVLAPQALDDAGPPEIPPSTDGLYHGERLDLTNTPDLGAYLQNVQKSYRLAPKVVLHLAGSGDHFTTPIRLKGTSLVLYFEPPPEKAEPLALVPTGEGGSEALIELEQGGLDLLGGTLRLSDAAEARVLPWLVKVVGGDVRLSRSRLEASPKYRGSAFRGLVLLDGAGESARACAVNESVLLSPGDGIDVRGVGARLLLEQTLLIAGDDALQLALEPGYAGKADVQCLLDHVTVSARGAVLRLPDVKRPGPPAEPVIVQTHDSAFLNLLPGRAARPALVLYDGEALARGLLVWQSDNDAFDRRLWFGAASTDGPLPDRPDSHSTWVALWGTPALRHATLDLALVRTLDPEQWSLERLSGLKIPGANLEKLGVGKKPAKKSPR